MAHGLLIEGQNSNQIQITGGFMNMRRVFLVFLLILTMAVTVNCGGSGGPAPAAGGGDADPEIAATAPEGDFDGDGIVNSEDDDDDDDGTPDADDCAEFDPDIYPGAVDDPDDEYVDANCDGADGDADSAVWVSVDEGAPGNPGTIDQPVDTIVEGLTIATTDPGNIRDLYIVTGEYQEDVHVEGGASLYGGYGLLDSGARDRDIETNNTTIVPKACASTTILVDGAPMTLFYTMFVDNSDSTINGLTIVGTQNGFGLFIRNSSATIINNKLNDNTPSAPRDVTVTVAITTDSTGTDDYAININNNDINMRGNGQPLEVSFGIIAIPEDGAENSLALSVIGNNIRSTGESGTAIGIYAVDNDGIPGDDETTDGNASYDLVADGNIIEMTGLYDDAGAAIMAGPMMSGGLSADRLYINSATVSNNQIFMNGSLHALIGVIVGYTREDSVVSNNVISITGSKVEGAAIYNVQASLDVYYNTIYVEGYKMYTYGVSSIFASDTPESLNYGDTEMGDVTNNIFSLSSEGCGGVIGIYERMENDDATLLERVSPKDVMNNLFHLQNGCPSQIAFYADEQRPAPELYVDDLGDLHAKVGFLAGDPTVFDSNIEGDPLFTDPVLRDFTVMTGSPAIDSGYDFEEGWLDILGTSRPQGEEVDIGAFEQ